MDSSNAVTSLHALSHRASRASCGTLLGRTTKAPYSREGCRLQPSREDRNTRFTGYTSVEAVSKASLLFTGTTQRSLWKVANRALQRLRDFREDLDGGHDLHLNAAHGMQTSRSTVFPSLAVGSWSSNVATRQNMRSVRFVCRLKCWVESSFPYSSRGPGQPLTRGMALSVLIVRPPVRLYTIRGAV